MPIPPLKRSSVERALETGMLSGLLIRSPYVDWIPYSGQMTGNPKVMPPDLVPRNALPSVITSKAANGYHFKTGQRDWPCGTENVLPCRLLWWQVGFGAPASRAAFEHMAVVQ